MTNRETVTIPKFGKFEPFDSPAREYRNPKTEEKVWKPATTRVKFRPFKHFKDCVAEGKIVK